MLNPFDRETRSVGRPGLRTGAIALALMAMLLPACSQNEAEVNPQASERQEEAQVTTEEVAGSTEELIGQTVTVRGEVTGFGDSQISFFIDDDMLFGGEDILVINATGTPFVLPEQEGMKVQVTGEVRQFKRADIQGEFDLNLGADYDEYEEKPALIAQSMALAPEPGKVAEDPTMFYGQTIAVKGEVDEIVSPNAFRLDEENLLVVNVGPGQTFQDGEDVVVTGQVRTFVLAELEREYDLTWDLDMQRKLEAEYSNQPVFIADGIYPSAE